MDFSTTIPFFGGSAAKQLKKKSPKGDLKTLFKGEETSRNYFLSIRVFTYKTTIKRVFAALHHQILKRIILSINPSKSLSRSFK
jgi:hypothetical protein